MCSGRCDTRPRLGLRADGSAFVEQGLRHLEIARVDQDLALAAFAAEALERRVFLPRGAVRALEPVCPQEPAQDLGFRLAGDGGHAHGLGHAEERTAYAEKRTS